MSYRLGVILTLLGMLSGCAPYAGQWDVASLWARHPELLDGAQRRLGDTTPYLIPRGQSAILFLCHFPSRSTVSVSLPSNATAREQSAIRLALEGWGNAGLGLHFEEVPEASAMIKIRLASLPGTGPAAARAIGTGFALSDCGFDSGWDAAGKTDGPIPARLFRSTVTLRTSKTDMLGREVRLTEDELVGAALHELGHALGFSGHVATPGSVMSRTTDSVRRFGRNLRRAGEFDAPSLVALYAVPSGTVVGRVDLAESSAALFDAVMKLADRQGWQGPIVRAGDSAVSLNWQKSNAPIGSLTIRDYRERLGSGQPLSFSKSSLEGLLPRPVSRARSVPSGLSVLPVWIRAQGPE